MESPFKAPEHTWCTNHLDLKDGKTNHDIVDFLLSQGFKKDSEDSERIVMIGKVGMFGEVGM